IAGSGRQSDPDQGPEPTDVGVIGNDHHRAVFGWIVGSDHVLLVGGVRGSVVALILVHVIADVGLEIPLRRVHQLIVLTYLGVDVHGPARVPTRENRVEFDDAVLVGDLVAAEKHRAGTGIIVGFAIE